MRLADLIYKLGTGFGKLPRFLSLGKIRQLFISGYYGSKFASCGKRFRLSTPIKFIHGAHHIHIGDDVCIHPFIRIEAIESMNCPPPIIVVGNRCGLGYNTQINACNRIEIGDDVLFASNVYITDHYHGTLSAEENLIPPTIRSIYSKGPVIVGARCWLGQYVSIMPNVTLGEGCIVGANSVVTHSFPAYSVIAGCPAKVIRVLE